MTRTEGAFDTPTEDHRDDRRTLPATTTDALARARALRTLIAANGAQIDRDATDPTDALNRVGDAGLAGLAVPVEYGGLWNGPGWTGIGPLFEAMIELSAGDGSVGQVWSQSMGTACSLFTTGAVPDDARRTIAHELLHDGRRLVTSNAETGTAGTVVATAVDGGIVVNGVKSFNTGSGRGGRDLAAVGLRLLGEDGDPAHGTAHRALVRLDDPGVDAAGDWDMMGQRSTGSQTIAYHDVFVPDGWHFASESPSPLFLVFARCMHAAVLHGIGEGALDAAVAYVRELDRPSLPVFGTARDDITLHRRIGEAACGLAASRALVLQVASAISTFSPPADPLDVVMDGIQARVAATRTTLETAQGIFELTGARSAANRHGLDRFWRNARTLSTHDPLDASTALVGKQILKGELPPLGDYFRIG